VEVIELVNNGSGLGFGIIGGQQAGVIVKTILPDGVADRDGRLKPNDFILQVLDQLLKMCYVILNVFRWMLCFFSFKSLCLAVCLSQSLLPVDLFFFLSVSLSLNPSKFTQPQG
jgi:hypothetical protein